MNLRSGRSIRTKLSFDENTAHLYERLCRDKRPGHQMLHLMLLGLKWENAQAQIATIHPQVMQADLARQVSAPYSGHRVAEVQLKTGEDADLQSLMTVKIRPDFFSGPPSDFNA